MLSHGFWFLMCDALAVYRLAILVTRDEITAALRGRLHGEFRRLRVAAFITCPWCVSIWLAAGVVALTRFYPSEWQYGAMFLALSGAAGFLAER